MKRYGIQIFMTRICICVFAVSLTMLAPLIVQIGADFGLGLGGSGFLFTAYYISNVFFCLLTPRLIRLLGKKRALAAGLIVYGVSTLCFSQARSLVVACVLISVMGALATFIEAVGMDIIDSLASDAAASNLTVTHAFAGIGCVVGVLYAGTMLQYGMSWRVIYFVLSIAVGMVALLYCVMRFPKMPVHDAGSLRDITNILKKRSFYPTFLALFLYVGAEGAIAGWMATYMTRQLGYSALVASVGTSLIWFTLTLGRMVCARLVVHWSVRRIVSMLTVICVTAILCAVLLPSALTFWVALVGIGCGMSGMWPLIASTPLQTGNNGGSIMSIILLFGYFGSSVIPYLVGLIGDALGMKTAILAGALCFALMGLTVRYVIPRHLSDRNHQDEKRAYALENE